MIFAKVKGQGFGFINMIISILLGSAVCAIFSCFYSCSRVAHVLLTCCSRVAHVWLTFGSRVAHVWFTFGSRVARQGEGRFARGALRWGTFDRRDLSRGDDLPGDVSQGDVSAGDVSLGDTQHMHVGHLGHAQQTWDTRDDWGQQAANRNVVALR